MNLQGLQTKPTASRPTNLMELSTVLANGHDMSKKEPQLKISDDLSITNLTSSKKKFEQINWIERTECRKRTKSGSKKAIVIFIYAYSYKTGEFVFSDTLNEESKKKTEPKVYDLTSPEEIPKHVLIDFDINERKKYKKALKLIPGMKTIKPINFFVSILIQLISWQDF